jgi:pseudoazurin
MIKRRHVAILMLGAWLATPAWARDLVVHMKNQGVGGAMVFEPMLTRAAIGDVIRFIPADPGHNAQSIPGMLPVGAAPVMGQFGKEVDLKVTKAGLYGIACRPHLGMGMIALVQVGAGISPNLAAARATRLPPLAARRMDSLLAQVR